MNEKEGTMVDQEYKIWKKNVKYMYDLVFTQSLKWPSTSMQWFPEIERENNCITKQKVLLSTFTSQMEQEKILIGCVSFPDTTDDANVATNVIKFNITQAIPVPGEINKSRFCPQATNLLALKTEESDILIYDTTKHASFSNSTGNQYSNPDARLKGHTAGGFAMDWNKTSFGQIVSGGGDKVVCVFDVNTGLIHSYNKLHSDIVNDVSYNSFNPNVFASVSDDLKLVVTDTRADENETKMVREKAHVGSIESVDFSPFKSELISTASSDNHVKVWDMRHLESPLINLRGHSNDVMKVKWSPHYESILASSSKDRKVNIWDLNKSTVVSDATSNELLFSHGGHTNTVSDFDWNPAEPIEICSVSDDNFMHVWKIPIEEYI